MLSEKLLQDNEERSIPLTQSFSAKQSFSSKQSIHSIKSAQHSKDSTNLLDVEELVLRGADKAFATAVFALLSNNGSALVTQEIFSNFTATLENGEFQSKVQILCGLMDADNDGCIDATEVKLYIKEDSILKKLGFQSGHKSYDEVFELFQNSDRGQESIDVFCQQVLRALNVETVQAAIARKSEQIERKSPTSMTSASFRRNLIQKYYSISKEDWFMYVVLALQAFLFAYNFHHYYTVMDAQLPVCFAKGFGLNLRVITVGVVLSMSRTAMGAFNQLTFWNKFVPMGFNVAFHSFCGFSLTFHSIGHTTAHVLNRLFWADAGLKAAFSEKTRENMGGGQNVTTGFILIVVILLMAYTAMDRGRSSQAYLTFYYTHFLYIWWLLLSIVHVPWLWRWFVIIMIWTIAERLNDYFSRTFHTTLTYSRQAEGGVTFLNFPFQGKVLPGTYYRIKIPLLNQIEWHPFSLASGESANSLSFFVDSVGDWTKDLYKAVGDEEVRSGAVALLQGPFLAPAHEALSGDPNKVVLLVAAGVGITPFLSVVVSAVSKGVVYEREKKVFASVFGSNDTQTLVKEGIMSKKGRLNTSWTTRLFKLTNSSLRYYESSSRAQERLLGQYTLDADSKVVDEPAHKQYQFCMKLYAKGSNGADELVLAAESNAALQEWKEAINQVILLLASEGKSISRPSVKLAQELQVENIADIFPKKKTIRLVWSIRNASELLFYIDYLQTLVESQGSSSSITESVKIDVFLTGLGSATDMKHLVAQTLFLMSLANNSGNFMKIHFGRPNIKLLIKDFKPNEAYYCGGNMLRHILEHECFENDIPVFVEDFDTPPQFLKNVKAYFSTIGRAKKKEDAKPTRGVAPKKTNFKNNDAYVMM